MRNLIVVIAIAVLVIFGLVIFSPGGGNPSKSTTAKPLSEYADTDATTSLLIDGEINGQEQHRSIKIVVGQNFRTMNIYKGYNGSILSSKTYSNSEAAYNAFLSALNLQGFTKERDASQDTPDGVCPFESRYTYELNGAGDEDFSRWSSDCEAGSFGGKADNVINLFENQIPNYDDITSDVELD